MSYLARNRTLRGPLGRSDSRHVFVGDIHGCFDELVALLEVEIRVTARDTVVLLGDLVDRGPYPSAVVRYARTRGFLGVVGNHEDKLLRYLAHARAGVEPNPIAVEDSRRAQWLSLQPEDRAWLAALPRIADGQLGDHIWAAVHGGLETCKPLAEQDGLAVPYIRKVTDPDGLWSRNRGTTRQWAELWAQPVRVAYGHEIFPQVKIDRPGESACYGLDTGAFQGGHLSAIVVEDGEVTATCSVKSSVSARA